MVFMMVSSKLLKHSVIVAIDYWLAMWTSSKTNQSLVAGTDPSNVTTPAYSGTTTLPPNAPGEVGRSLGDYGRHDIDSKLSHNLELRIKLCNRRCCCAAMSRPVGLPSGKKTPPC